MTPFPRVIFESCFHSGKMSRKAKCACKNITYLKTWRICENVERDSFNMDFFKLPTSCTILLFFNNMYVTLRSSTCYEQHAARNMLRIVV